MLFCYLHILKLTVHVKEKKMMEKITKIVKKVKQIKKIIKKIKTQTIVYRW